MTIAPGSVVCVFGTRPEIIKIAPIARALGAGARLLFSGQHFDGNLSDEIFRSVSIDPASVERISHIGGRSRGKQITTLVSALLDDFERTQPAVVLVQGDTNSTNAGAQAGHYAGIPVIHVEAGLRSGDRAMPEETNRLLVGALADHHCCATAVNASTLRREGHTADRVHLTGNTIVEAVRHSLPSEAEQSRLLTHFSIPDTPYALATIHRTENTDDRERLCRILVELGMLGLHVVMPLHPRTRSAIEEEGLTIPSGIQLLPPIDHPSFLALAKRSFLLISDSGGVQEEVTVLGKGVVVVRTSTERPEAIDAGFSLLAEPSEIGRAVLTLTADRRISGLATRASPFGDGHAAERIARLCRTVAGARENHLPLRGFAKPVA